MPTKPSRIGRETERGPRSAAGRASVLEAFLETPEIIAACARGSGLTECQVKDTLRNLIADAYKTH